MRKAHAFALAGLGALTLAGAAAAASPGTHTLTVPLPDGSTARVEYVGDVAPKVTVAPPSADGLMGPLRLFDRAFFDRSLFDMDRQMDELMRQTAQLARQAQAGTPVVNVAAYGNAPAGTTSVTVVSTSDGTQTCTRRTEVTSRGAGKPPQVVTSLSGDCGGSSAGGQPKTPTS